MKNWRTTLIGAAFAAVTFISTYQANGGNLDDWKLWVIPALAAALGYVAKDAGVSGSAKMFIAALCLLSLPACSNPADTQRAVAIGKLGLDLLVKRGVITAEDAATAREAGQILITPAATPAAKQPVPVQP